jgi:hypothetical protein
MRVLATVLISAGLLAWARLHPLDGRRQAAPALVGLGVVVALLSLQAPSEASFDLPAPTMAPVPDVVGQSPDIAVSEIVSAGFSARVVRACSPSSAGERVEGVYRIERNPWWSLETPLVTAEGTTAAGSAVRIGTELLLRVPDGSSC